MFKALLRVFKVLINDMLPARLIPYSVVGHQQLHLLLCWYRGLLTWRFDREMCSYLVES